MRRTISGTAVAVLASVTLLAGCAGDAETVDPAVEDPALTEDPLEDPAATMDDMATMEPTDS